MRGDCIPQLLALHDNACCVVDAERQADLDRFAAGVLAAVAAGKRFLFRSAASLLTALAHLPPQPVAAEAMSRFVRDDRAGAVLVGSHVRKTTTQLAVLLREPGTVGIEIDVNRLPQAQAAVRAAVLESAAAAHARRLTPVIYTSRNERSFADPAARLAFGEQVSALLMEIVQGLPATLGFLISKGGITSNDVLSTGLGLRAARLLGQVLTGCSVVRCPRDHPRFAELPVVIFPGNVGDEDALAEVYRRLARPAGAQRRYCGA